MDSKNYNRKLSDERDWYERTRARKSFWHHPLIFSYERLRFNIVFPKKQMVEVLRKFRAVVPGERVLIAPCGRGEDVEYVEDLSVRITGIDVSLTAVGQCPDTVNRTAGDVFSMPFIAESFDIVVAPLFFHHYDRGSFDRILREFRRVLKPGGSVVILEPSLFYPFNLITRPIKKLFANPFGEVPGEGPISPFALIRALRSCGYDRIRLQAATYSHCSFYTPLSLAVNYVTRWLLNCFPLKYCGWLVVFYAERKK